MLLQKLIKKLKESNCTTPEDKKNVYTNIKICEMQIKIIEKLQRKINKG